MSSPRGRSLLRHDEARDPASTLRGCGGRGRGGSRGLRGRRRQSNGSSDTTEASDNGTGSVVQSAQQLCDSLESLDSTVQDIGSDPEETTVSDVKDGLAQLRSEVSDVASSGSALAGALGAALQSAFDQFESTVEDLPDDETLEAAGGLARSAVGGSSSRGAAPWTRSTASGPPAPEHRVSSALGDAGRRSVGVWLSTEATPVQAVDTLPGWPRGGPHLDLTPIHPSRAMPGTERGGTVAVMDEGEQAELERLRAEQERLQHEVDDLRTRADGSAKAQRTQRHRIRRVVAVALVVTTSLMFTIAATGVWPGIARSNTNRWVSTVTPIAADPRCRRRSAGT